MYDVRKIFVEQIYMKENLKVHGYFVEWPSKLDLFWGGIKWYKTINHEKCRSWCWLFVFKTYNQHQEEAPRRKEEI